jgi:hypothetical protein
MVSIGIVNRDADRRTGRAGVICMYPWIDLGGRYCSTLTPDRQSLVATRKDVLVSSTVEEQENE